MVFSNEQLPHMFNKIIEEINKLALNTNKIEVNDLRKIIVNFRLTKSDVAFFIKYLQDHEIIERKGKLIYLLNKIEGKKKHPGRPSKLSEEEKQWIKENYIPGEVGVKRLANKLNEKRDDPISYQALHKYHIC